MKCSDKQDIHVSLACDHTSTVATGNVVPSTPSIHVQESELQSIMHVGLIIWLIIRKVTPMGVMMNR